MDVITDYFASQERSLSESFARIRKTHSDSDVKGGANEGTVTEFLRRHISAASIISNVQIIDSNGSASGEIDVCVCNADQPFAPQPGQIVIAEGVDFVVQVKATLTTKEIERLVKNCESVKQLIRKSNSHDTVLVAEADIPYYADRIPYFVFAFESELSFDTASESLHAELSKISFELQPDAVFVLGRGVFLNFRDGKGFTWLKEGESLTGLFALQTDRILTEFITYILRVVPRFIRHQSPLLHYLPSEQALFYPSNNESC